MSIYDDHPLTHYSRNGPLLSFFNFGVDGKKKAKKDRERENIDSKGNFVAFFTICKGHLNEYMII